MVAHLVMHADKLLGSSHDQVTTALSIHLAGNASGVLETGSCSALPGENLDRCQQCVTLHACRYKYCDHLHPLS